MTRAAERLFALVRATLRNRMDDASLFEGTDAAQWREIYDLSSVQGVLAQAWDGMQLLPEAMRPPRALRLQWAVNVERIEKVYRRQERAIARLAAFYRRACDPDDAAQGLRLEPFLSRSGTPSLRGHRHLAFRASARGRQAGRREWGVPVDVHKEHHTTFDVDGIMVENHYDFVNKETHASNARLERLFKQYAAQPGESVAVAGVAVYLPSEQLNALFLLRHAAVHFAAINIGLRHVLDWCVFVAHCHDRIDWPALYAVARETRMVGFLNCLNALCVDCLGLEARRSRISNATPNSKSGCWTKSSPRRSPASSRRVAARGPVQDPPLVGEPLETPAGLRRGSCRRLRAFSLGASETSAVDRRVTVLSGTNPGFGCTGEFCRRPPERCVRKPCPFPSLASCPFPKGVLQCRNRILREPEIRPANFLKRAYGITRRLCCSRFADCR